MLTTREVKALLDELDGTMWLVVALLYGTGVRLLEGLRLRAKDIDFERRAIAVREGKGAKDRVTMLPEHLVSPMRESPPKAGGALSENLTHRLLGTAQSPDTIPSSH